MEKNTLFNSINHSPDIDKIYSYAMDPYGAIVEYSNDMDDIYIEEYNPNKKRKILIFLDYMIADMLSNKKLNPIVTELFFSGRKLKISLVFITKFYFAVPKKIRMNSTHYFIMKFQIKKSFNKSNLNIYQILAFKTL